MINSAIADKVKPTYVQKGKTTYFHINNISYSKLSEVIEEVTIEGHDELGTWRAEGAFMRTVDEPFFFMFKLYDDREKAGQTGQW